MARIKDAKDKLTKQQEVFVNELIKGSSQRQAYIKAYPSKKKWKENALDVNASMLLKEDKVRGRYEELLAKCREKEQANTMWTREESIENLRFVVDANRKDLERINKAHEDEIEALLKAIIENPDKAVQLTKELMNIRKSRRTSQVNNKGITEAVSELNKMQGFNEENINLNGTVVFNGEDKLEE